MVTKYKINVIGITICDWQQLRNAIFNGAQPVEETYGGQIGAFTFAGPVDIVELSPLIKVEKVNTDTP